MPPAPVDRGAARRAHRFGSRAVSKLRPRRGAVSATVIAYTDGACSGNPGTGAWAYRLEWPDGSVDEAVGGDRRTTNNREELKAVREALLRFRKRAGEDPSWRIVVRTDSMGVINWLTRVWKR